MDFPQRAAVQPPEPLGFAESFAVLQVAAANLEPQRLAVVQPAQPPRAADAVRPPVGRCWTRVSQALAVTGLTVMGARAVSGLGELELGDQIGYAVGGALIGFWTGVAAQMHFGPANEEDALRDARF